MKQLEIPYRSDKELTEMITKKPIRHLPEFDGATYDPKQDRKRLTGQLDRVYDIMKDGQYRTLSQIQAVSHTRFGKMDSEAAISARLRDFRKDKVKALYPDVAGMDSRREGSRWVYKLIIT